MATLHVIPLEYYVALPRTEVSVPALLTRGSILQVLIREEYYQVF